MSSEHTPTSVPEANIVADKHDADILFMNGPMEHPTDLMVMDLCESRRRRKNVILILVTVGGDANAAYRIARCLQELYERFVFFVSGYCKSAGTIVSLGAHEIVMSDRGELGPLDAQLQKEDELFQTRSGLTVLSALSTLHQQAYDAYEHFLLQTKFRSRGEITTKTANQTAATLTGELFGRVYEHIDPMHVGEAGRFLKVAHQYGQILQRQCGNCKPGTLDKLTTQYPSHSFIIDRLQAKELFVDVRSPLPEEIEMIRPLGAAALEPRNQNLLLTFLNEESASEEDPHENTKTDHPVETTDSTDDDGNGEIGGSEAH